MKPVQEQLAAIKRGTTHLEPEAELKAKLERGIKTGKPLRIKYGIDPTGIDVHLGHTVPLRKLRVFQELGHQAVLIIGNYTALVGDPSGRDQSRARLTQEQVEANAKDYLKQVSKVIDIRTTEVHFNGDWFGKFQFLDVLALTSKITMQRMLERDDFTKRLKAGTPIYLHECLYPLMQGHDSVAIRADVELGGTEQLFSLMAGRDLQRDAGQEPQVCLTLPILRGLDGDRRMGKSLGNYIGVAESPREVFGKTMSIPDQLMREWFELLTDRESDEIARLTDPAQTHPRLAKECLARDIITFYHGSAAAEDCAREFKERFGGDRKDPADIEEVPVKRSDLTNGEVGIVRLLVLMGFAKSNNDARRLLGPNSGITIGEERMKIVEPDAKIRVTDGLIVRSGVKRVKKVRLAD